MKYVGFLKTIDVNIPTASTLQELLVEGVPMGIFREQILEYLQNATILTASPWTNYDSDGELISEQLYFTDTVYCWPSYYPFFIRKYGVSVVDEGFLQRMILYGFRPPTVDESELVRLAREFGVAWSKKND